MFKFFLQRILLLTVFVWPAGVAGGIGKPLLYLKKVPGLSQNTVYSLRQDSAGFIWVATGDGLNRFDGRKFDVYKPGNARSANMQGYILRYPLVYSNKQSFWFFTESGNNYYDGIHDLVTPLAANIADSVGLNFVPLAEQDNLLWLYDASGNLLAVDETWKKNHLVPAPGFSRNQAIQKTAINSRYIFIAWYHVAGIFDKITRQWQQLPFAGTVDALACSETELIACTGPKILRWQIGAANITEIQPAKGIPVPAWRAAFIDQVGNIWTGDANGYVYECEAGKTTFSVAANVNEGNSEGSHTSVYSLLVDRSFNLWVGTDGLGLLKVDLKSPGFNSFPATRNPASGLRYFVKAICEDYQGNVWLGVLGKGLLLMKQGRNEPEQITLPLSKNDDQLLVRCIIEDSDLNLLVGYHNIVAFKKKNDRVFKSVALPDSSKLNSVQENVLSILQLSRRKWLVFSNWRTCILTESTNGELVCKRLINFSFSCKALVAENTLLAASESGIIYRLNIHDSGDKFEVIAKNIFVKAISQDSVRKELFWMSTKSGLVLYNSRNKTFRSYNQPDGLVNNFVYGCLQKENLLWLSTNTGLARVRVGADEKDGFPRLTADYFTSEDGLQGDEFNSNAFHIGRTGKFYFGSVSGLTWFYPDSISQNVYEPSLVLKSAETDNVALPAGSNIIFLKKIRLPYNHRNLVVRFAALEFSNPAQNKYAWRMIGVQNNWIDNGNQNEIRIANLPYGNYNLEVKASNNSGIWMKQPVVLQLTIMTPFWRKWWFMALVFSVLIAASSLFTRNISQRKLKLKIIQLEYERSLETERGRIAREMHDDVGAGLTQISFLSEGARRQVSHKNQVESDLQRIADKSRDLVRSISEIVWSLNAENNTLESLFFKMHEDSSEQLELSGISFNIAIPRHIPPFRISSQLARNVLLVVKELVNNAIRHSSASDLTIEVTVTEIMFTISIYDNGQGLPVVQKSKGHGIANIKRRISELNGTLSMVNANGLHAEITIPLHSIRT